MVKPSLPCWSVSYQIGSGDIVSLDALAQVVGRLAVAVPFGGQLKAAHRLGVECEEVGLRACRRGRSSTAQS